MFKKRFFQLLIAVSVCLLFSSGASALTKGFEASSFHAAVDDSPYISQYGADTLEQWQFNVGTLVNYAYRPLQLIRNGERYRGIVDHELMQDVYGSVGLVGRRLQFGVDVPVAWWVNWKDPNVATATAENKITMGDVFINFKSELVDIDKHRVGLALLPFIELPSGKGKYYTGNGGVSGGGKLIFEVKPVDRWSIGLNAGALARPYYKLSNVEQTHQLLYGMGTAVDLTKNLAVAAEVSGRAKLKDMFANKEESPVEADGGLKYSFGDSGVSLTAGGGAGIVSGSGAPKARAFLGLSYLSKVYEPKKIEEAVAPAPSRLDELNRAVIYFLFDSTKFANSNDEETLKKVTEILKQETKANVEVAGYTDSVGDDKYNKKLSQKRANIIKTDLEKGGIDSERVTSVGYGEGNPKGDNKTKQGRQENRRVEFKVK